MNNMLPHTTCQNQSRPAFPRRTIFIEKVKCSQVNFLHGYKESASHHHENDDGFYRAQYFSAIDEITETIKNRFDQPG